MANLNLSEFGENTSVSNADYTFVWDSANAISKKVSRNSWLNSGTLTSDAPVTISQTWNQIGTAFTAFKVNAVSTASASGSLLLDLQVGTVSQFSVNKSGNITTTASAISSSASTFDIILGGLPIVGVGLQYFGLQANAALRWTSSGVDPTAAPSVALVRDDADNTLALRNGAAAQTFNVYGTSSASNANYARLALTCGLDGNATISTQALGTGTAGVLAFSPGNSERMRITTAGNVGIGTTSPTSKLQVTNGDVEIETVTSGIIMKAAGTANRFRITLNAGGTDFVITAL